MKQTNKYIKSIDIENLGFYRVFISSPKNKVADIVANKKNIIEEIKKAEKEQANFILFPELSISSATCQMMFWQDTLLEKSYTALLEIVNKTKNYKIISIITLPLLFHDKIYSVAAVVFMGKILGFVPLKPEQHLKAFFSKFNLELNSESVEFLNDIPFAEDLTFSLNTESGSKFSFGIGSHFLENNKCPELLFMPLAEPSSADLDKKLHDKFAFLSEKTHSAIAFTNAGYGESSSAFVFLGEKGLFENANQLAVSSVCHLKDENSIYADIDIELLKKKRLHTDSHKEDLKIKKIIQIDFSSKSNKDKSQNEKKSLERFISQKPFLPFTEKSDTFKKIISMQALSLAKRLEHINCKKCVLGLSGGLDSSLALLAGLYAFDMLKIPHENFYAVLLPAFGTTKLTKNNAKRLAELLNCSILEIDIRDSVLQHFKDIDHDENNHNAVYENSQARERTQVLMDLSNKLGAIMLGTGDLSESALGWTTYNGDHMSMYEINSSIAKTLIPDCLLSFTENKIFFKDDKAAKNDELKGLILKIINTPVSPELLPPKDGKIMQKTESIIGPYELHDFFLYHLVKNFFSPSKIFYLANIAFSEKYESKEILSCLEIFYKRFLSQQFKRSAGAEGASISKFSLSGYYWQMPSDIIGEIWLEELEKLSKIL